MARLDGKPVFVVGHQKGRNTRENLERNFGMSRPEGYRKALRVMKLAERFGRPIISFIDTPGAYPGVQAEERGQAEAIARNIMEMAASENLTSALPEMSGTAMRAGHSSASARSAEMNGST